MSKAFDCEAASLRESLADIGRATAENLDATRKLVEIFDGKVDQLINTVIGRGMIPVDSFKQLIVWVIVFALVLQFGIESVKYLFTFLNK